MQDDAFNKKIDERLKEVLPKYLSQGAFTARKLTDTPTDSLQVVNRRFVTLNGSTANRPRGSILGQSYFDTSIGKPTWWNGTAFVDATGTPV